MNISIGRAEDNTFVINDPEVSRYHAVLTANEANELILQDLLTTNGSFVNDSQVLMKRVFPEDKLTFGTNFSISVSDLLHGLNDYSDDFLRLKYIYDSYMKEKIRIQSKNQFKTRIFQTLPFAFIGIFTILMGFLGDNTHTVLIVVGFLLAICAPVSGIYLGARQAAKVPAMLQNLANQFKIDYVCPKCGIFLGEIPWESLCNKKCCQVSSCKANWIRT